MRVWRSCVAFVIWKLKDTKPQKGSRNNVANTSTRSLQIKLPKEEQKNARSRIDSTA
jgi:hypothetical protein